MTLATNVEGISRAGGSGINAFVALVICVNGIDLRRANSGLRAAEFRVDKQTWTRRLDGRGEEGQSKAGCGDEGGEERETFMKR